MPLLPRNIFLLQPENGDADQGSLSRSLQSRILDCKLEKTPVFIFGAFLTFHSFSVFRVGMRREREREKTFKEKHRKLQDFFFVLPTFFSSAAFENPFQRKTAEGKLTRRKINVAACGKDKPLISTKKS